MLKESVILVPNLHAEWYSKPFIHHGQPYVVLWLLQLICAPPISVSDGHLFDRSCILDILVKMRQAAVMYPAIKVGFPTPLPGQWKRLAPPSRKRFSHREMACSWSFLERVEQYVSHAILSMQCGMVSTGSVSFLARSPSWSRCEPVQNQT